MKAPKLLTSFLHCGLTGWCFEIIFTSLGSLRNRDFTLKGQTSLWMFPIYGSAAFLTPLFRLLKHKSPIKRGLTYMSLIFSAEYISGKLLRKKEFCPWDYSRAKWNIGKVIRLDYAPLWFLVGLFFEHQTRPQAKNTPSE